MTIVVGYVPRRDGLAALEAASREAVRTGDRLVVVASPDPTRSGGVDVRDVETVCRGLGLPADALEVRSAQDDRTAAELILATVEALGARLAVVGLLTGRPGGPGPVSAAETVIAAAACAVLAVRELGT